MNQIPISELDGVFRLIGKDWMLLTAEGRDPAGSRAANPMTASWGGMGVLWNKPVVFLFIRPQRYTYQLIEASTRLSVSFFTEEYREALRICGKLSGRDTDKFAAAGLSLTYTGGVPHPAEARLVLLCRKLYADDLSAAAFLDPALLSNYKGNDFHRMYVCEIESAYRADTLPHTERINA